MRIAFYAPLKPPDHRIPSGDRRMGLLLMEALAAAGHEVRLACRFRSREGAGDPERQRRLARLGSGLARRLSQRYLARPPEARPQLWFTYHLYYKAPDHLGPPVSAALGIPYVVAEPSHAGKRAKGPYAVGHAAAAAAIAEADALILLNAADRAGVLELADPARCHRLLPFLGPEATPRPPRATARAELAAELDLDQPVPWLLAVAMMRAPDKLASYRALARALGRLKGEPWHLIVVGDGPEREQVRASFADVRSRVTFAGRRDPDDLARFYAAADLFVWPAVNEAYGMAILEAEAAGLPVVAGRTGGVPDIVADGESGLLVRPEDDVGFAAAVGRLLEDPELCRRLGQAAAARVAARHGFAAAAQGLGSILARVAPP
jgi:Glycosyl transferases group 1